MRHIEWLGAVSLLVIGSGCTTYNCLASCVGGGTASTSVCAFSEDNAKSLSQATLTAACGAGGIMTNSCTNTMNPCSGNRNLLKPTADPISE